MAGGSVTTVKPVVAVEPVSAALAGDARTAFVLPRRSHPGGISAAALAALATPVLTRAASLLTTRRPAGTGPARRWPGLAAACRVLLRLLPEWCGHWC